MAKRQKEVTLNGPQESGRRKLVEEKIGSAEPGVLAKKDANTITGDSRVETVAKARGAQQCLRSGQSPWRSNSNMAEMYVWWCGLYLAKGYCSVE